MSNPIVLHGYWRSSCSYRVRAALLLKGIAFETNVVSLIKDGGQQFSEEFKRLNPMAEVPALEIDGHVLSQSVAILEYLEETRPEVPLLPRDPYQRALVRQLVSIIACDTQPVQNLRVLKKHGMEHRMEWGSWAITLGLTGFEATLAPVAGKFCVGDEITLADVLLVPQVYNAERFKVDLTPFPNIVRIYKTLTALPAFIAAHPDNQPDFDPEAK